MMFGTRTLTLTTLLLFAAGCADTDTHADTTYSVNWSMVQTEAVDQSAWIYGLRLDD